ncbi:MAG: preprotein translocase subunit YajC [Clostridiales bacterium]|nr:preprotein translocase subunit YajC [Clostridiales bacterium]
MLQNPIGNIGLLLLFIVLIYFMMIRPQKRKDKADREMRSTLQVGDEIMTIGGVIGKVVKITDKSVIITTGAERNKIEFIKTAISSVNRGENSKAAQKKNEENEPAVDDTKVSSDKKVTPKKLTKKSDN